MESSSTTMALLPACLLPPFPPPLEAPVALEGTNISLGTEILPPPPPTLPVINPKKPSDNTRRRALPSYLPSTDPGSTYNSGTGVKVVEYVHTDSEGDAERATKRKRIRTEKADSSRPKKPAGQRTSSALAVPSTLATDLIDVKPPHEIASVAGPSNEPGSVANPSAPLSEMMDAELPIATNVPSRSRRESSLLASSRLSQLDWSISGNGRRKERGDSASSTPVDVPRSATPRESILDGPQQREPESAKGKGKEKDVIDDHANSKFCSTCALSLVYSLSPSSILYCDGCPRSFHLCCLNPPVEESSLAKGEWYCNKCQLDKEAPQNLVTPSPTTLLSELITKVSTDLPSIYSLPEDIRNYFRDVGTTSLGDYIDIGELKISKSNRIGTTEDRDPYRLKDRSNGFILCYQCKQSAAPPSEFEAIMKGKQETAPLEPAVEWRDAQKPQPLVIRLYRGGGDRGGPSTISDALPESLALVQSDSLTLSPSPSQSQSSSNGRQRRRSRPVDGRNLGPRRSSSRLANSASLDSSESPAAPPPGGLLEPKIEPVSVSLFGPTQTSEQEQPESIAPPKGFGGKLGIEDTRSGWRAMISCDHCSLSWHLDCLDPPMVCLPPSHKKWMCPNHAENAMPKRRIPRHLKTITLPLSGATGHPSGSRRRTNGIIEIIPAPHELPPTPSITTRPTAPSSVEVGKDNTDPKPRKRKRSSSGPYAKADGFEDLFMNGVKYRMPERSVRLDFWASITKKQSEKSVRKNRSHRESDALPSGPKDLARERARRTLSTASSLSPLSTPPESEDDERPFPPNRRRSPELSLDQAASTLLTLQAAQQSHHTSTAVQTDLPPLLAPAPEIKTSKALGELLKTALTDKPPAANSLPLVTSSPNGKTSSFKIRIRMPGHGSNASSSPSTNATTTIAAPQSSSPGKGATHSRRPTRNREPTGSTIPPEVTRTPSMVNGYVGDPQRLAVPSPDHRTPSLTASPGGLTSLGISPEELEQLRAIRELMKAKGEKVMMDFLRS